MCLHRRDAAAKQRGAAMGAGAGGAFFSVDEGRVSTLTGRRGPPSPHLAGGGRNRSLVYPRKMTNLPLNLVPPRAGSRVGPPALRRAGQFDTTQLDFYPET